MLMAVRVNLILEQYMAGIVEMEPVNPVKLKEMNRRYFKRREKIVIVINVITRIINLMNYLKLLENALMLS